MERWYSSLVTKRVVFLAIAYFMPLFYTAFYQLDIIVLKAEIASLFMSQSHHHSLSLEHAIPFPSLPSSYCICIIKYMFKSMNFNVIYMYVQ